MMLIGKRQPDWDTASRPRWLQRSLFLVAIACMGLAACGGGDSGDDDPITNAPMPPPVPPPSQTDGFTVGGVVAGLRGSGLVLNINGANELTITASGSFAFRASLPSGASYSVSVVNQPDGPLQTCRVTNGTGVVASSNVSSISIDCITEISNENVDAVIGTGSALLELLPQLAELVGTRLAFLNDNLSARTSEDCPDPSLISPGQVSYDYFDADRDGVLSATDTVRMTFSNCFLQSIGDYVSTVVEVTVGTSPPQQAVRYRSGFSGNVTLRSFPAVAQTLSGRFGFVYTDAEELRVLRAQVEGSALVATGNGAFTPMDTVTVMDAAVVKTLDYVAAKYSLGGTINFGSRFLQGQFSLSTPQQLRQRFGIFPSEGTVEYRSARVAVRLTGRDVGDNHAALASADATNSNTFVDLGFVPWDVYFRGFSWYESRFGKSFVGRPQNMTRTRDEGFFNLISADPYIDPANLIISNDLDVDTPITLFYTAPIDLARTTLVFEPESLLGGAMPIPASVVINGAIAKVTGERQLEHGVGYHLVSTSGEVFTPGLDRGTTFNRLELRTRNNLQANGAASPGVVFPGQTVVLRSSRSFSADSSIVSTAWRQRRGASVELMDANTPTASFIAPVAMNDGESLVFEITVTDANGETDTVPVTVFLLSDPMQPFLYYRRLQGSNIGLVAEDPTLRSRAQGTVSSEFRFENEFDFFFNLNTSGGQFDSLQLVNFPEALTVGTFPLKVTTRLTIFALPFSCNDPVGRFVIREIGRGPANEVVSFAADFEQNCGAGTSSIIGSVRVNSSVALP